jgi:hypothetical protein
MRFPLLREFNFRVSVFLLLRNLYETQNDLTLRRFLEIHCRDLVRSTNNKRNSYPLHIESEGVTSETSGCPALNGFNYDRSGSVQNTPTDSRTGL